MNLAELKTIPDIKCWLEPHNGNMGENMAEWMKPRHCTACCYALGENVNYAIEVQNAFGMEFKITTTDLWIGEEEIGLEVRFAKQQCNLMYQSMNTTPHVTLMVAEGHKVKEIGTITT